MSCVFCAIRDGREPASVVFEDDGVLAFMDIRPIRSGQLLVIPKDHVDHFTDLDDDVAAAVFLHGQRLARVLRATLEPKRVGMIVHGFGVPHAHLVVVPLEHPWDITAAQFAEIRDGSVTFRWEAVPLAERPALDRMAARIRAALATSSTARFEGAGTRTSAHGNP